MADPGVGELLPHRNSQSHSSRMPGIKRKGTERIGKHRNTETLPRNSHGQTASSISDDEGSTLQQMLLDFFKARLLRDSSCLCDKMRATTTTTLNPKPLSLPLADSEVCQPLNAKPLNTKNARLRTYRRPMPFALHSASDAPSCCQYRSLEAAVMSQHLTHGDPRKTTHILCRASALTALLARFRG